MMVSMGTTTTALLTFEEFEALPDQPGKLELLYGELIEMPVAAAKHTKIGIYIFKRTDSALSEAKSRGEASELGEAHHEMGLQTRGRALFSTGCERKACWATRN
jgi:hypothetical protein